MTSRELLEILRGLASCHLVSADVVEVAPRTITPRSPPSPRPTRRTN